MPQTIPSFVPESFDPADLDQVVELLTALRDRDLGSASDLRAWLDDLAALDELLDEEGALRRIANSCHTNDEAIEQRYLEWVQRIEPKLKPWFFELQKKFVESPHRETLPERGLQLMGRFWEADVDLFREENVALQTKVTERTNDYHKLCGKQMVEFDDQKLTLQQLARYYDHPDRQTREQAWRLGEGRRAEDREKFDEIFNELMQLRQQIAENCGLDSYRDYAWRSKKRFDYSPDDCLAFADAVEATCMPLVEKLDRQRREALGVESLRPWDLAVDIRGRSPLRPFDAEDIGGFVDGVEEMFRRIDPMLAASFATLRDGDSLDLESREGKRPGGYQSSLEASKKPFIFMNAAGLQRDVETMLHEGGHAFHFLDASGLFLYLRHAPLEFCEVASMSMESLGRDHLDVFYEDPADADRARRDHLEGIIRLLPWVATIDSFQHWLYTHPNHSTEQRHDAWLEIHSRFSSREVDYTGIEDVRQYRWQRQLHLFGLPFYYIEYGIAQLGALQVWINYQRDPKRTLGQLRMAFALGGSEPLPKLFETAGIEFRFDGEMVEHVIAAVGEELDRLPQ